MVPQHQAKERSGSPMFSDNAQAPELLFDGNGAESPDPARPSGLRLVDDGGTRDSERGRIDSAVVLLGLDGSVTDWDPGAEKLLGYLREEVLGRPFAVLFAAEEGAEFRRIREMVNQGRAVTRPSVALIAKKHRRIEVSLVATPMRDRVGNPSGIILVLHDLTIERELDLQYRQAQKMEVFGKLAGGIAHDFNNLLTVILGYAEILAARLSANDARRELLTEIYKAGERAESLTRQLLTFSRKQGVEPKVLDINHVISDTEKMLRRLIGEDILTTTIFSASPWLVKIDPGQLQQVILNLAVNARDAMPNGGRLTIETDNVTFDDVRALSHSDIEPGDYVLLAVGDTGVGMDASTQSHLFESHFTTKAPGKGTGLGLMMVHSIVKQYGGHIEVLSEIGHGSTFKVYLPASDESPTRKARSSMHAVPRGSETILLVEDEDSVRSLARHVLETCGYRVLEAADGDVALALAESYPAPIQLLVTDVVMPHVSGRAVAERLLEKRPEMRVLFLSGYTSDAIERHGLGESDYPFLQKPFTSSLLAKTVRRVLDARVK